MSNPDNRPLLPGLGKQGPNDPHNDDVIFVKIMRDGDFRVRMVVLDEGMIVAAVQFLNPNDIPPVAVMDSDSKVLLYILDEGRLLASLEFSNPKDKPIIAFHE